MLLDPLRLTPDHDLPAALLTELTALYASQHEFHALSGDFPDPDDIRPEQVAAALADGTLDGRRWSREELAEEREPVWPSGLARLLDAWETDRRAPDRPGPA
jgi:hypothetical protein